jgi:hypothetical protein
MDFLSFVLAVASSAVSFSCLELASVILTSAPKLLRASVAKTECSWLISLGAQVCPTSVSSTHRELASVFTTSAR